MGDPIDLRTNPIFIAEEIYCDPISSSSYKMAVGTEKGACSYYTKVTIVKGPLPSGGIEELRKALSETLEKLGKPSE
jgi:hypothetical protein